MTKMKFPLALSNVSNTSLLPATFICGVTPSSQRHAQSADYQILYVVPPVMPLDVVKMSFLHPAKMTLISGEKAQNENGAQHAIDGILLFAKIIVLLMAVVARSISIIT